MRRYSKRINSASNTKKVFAKYAFFILATLYRICRIVPNLRYVPEILFLPGWTGAQWWYILYFNLFAIYISYSSFALLLLMKRPHYRRWIHHSRFPFRFSAYDPFHDNGEQGGEKKSEWDHDVNINLVFSFRIC